MNLVTAPLPPFGIEATAPPGTPLADLPAARLKELVAEHRLVVLRGFVVPPDDAGMLAFCRTLGELLEWEFGTVNELKPRDDARNYLYTEREVPFHWDGAFVGRVPHYIFFHCVEAPPAGSGGETTFCDTVRLLGRADAAERQRWAQATATYSTEKVVHYGGTFTSPLVARHPVSGEEVLRFAEPVSDLNPVTVTVHGLDGEAFFADVRGRLRDPALCYAHAWRVNDVLVADNHALLHGRRALARSAPRHLRRVNVL
jgi:alpha-ketoglutarate-dependent taurine dioxygenase